MDITELKKHKNQRYTKMKFDLPKRLALYAGLALGFTGAQAIYNPHSPYTATQNAAQKLEGIGTKVNQYFQGMPSRRHDLRDFLDQAKDGLYDNTGAFAADNTGKKLAGTNKRVRTEGTYTLIPRAGTGGPLDKDKRKQTMPRTETSKAMGSASIIHQDRKFLYLLTNEHVIHHEPTVTFGNMFTGPLLGVLTGKNHTMQQGNDLYRGTVVASNKGLDYAVLQVPKTNDRLRNLPTVGKVGSSAELEYGDFLYIAGYPRDIGATVQGAHFKGHPDNPNFTFPNVFLIDGATQPGNSGGGVYALRDGKPELVGILQIGAGHGMSGAVPINSIRRDLKKKGLEHLLIQED